MTQFSALKKQLDKGNLSNLYIFTGEEREVLLKYIKRIDEKASTCANIQEAIPKMTTKNLFSKSKRTFVVKNDKELLKYDLDKLKKLTKNDRLIIVFDKADGRSKLFKSCKDYHTEFKKFEPNQLVSFVQSKLEVDDRLAFIIAHYCNYEISRVENEVDKLNLLEEEITLDIVNDLITPPPEDKIFEFVEKVVTNSTKEAIDLYEDLLKLGESPIKLISLLYTKFKQVFVVQTYFKLDNAMVSGKTGLTFAQVKYTRPLCNRIDLTSLTEILAKIQKTELKIKTGQLDINLAMDTLLLDILNKYYI
jgi:DNA polymerase-3 subunit delta